MEEEALDHSTPKRKSGEKSLTELGGKMSVQTLIPWSECSAIIHQEWF